MSFSRVLGHVKRNYPDLLKDPVVELTLREFLSRKKIPNFSADSCKKIHVAIVECLITHGYVGHLPQVLNVNARRCEETWQAMIPRLIQDVFFRARSIAVLVEHGWITDDDMTPELRKLLNDSVIKRIAYQSMTTIIISGGVEQANYVAIRDSMSQWLTEATLVELQKCIANMAPPSPAPADIQVVIAEPAGSGESSREPPTAEPIDQSPPEQTGKVVTATPASDDDDDVPDSWDD